MIYVDAETLEQVLRAELIRLRDAKIITAADATLPDLGPLPPASPSGSRGSPDPEEDSAAEEEEDEEEEEEEPEDGAKKRRVSTRRRNTSSKATSSKRDAADGDGDGQVNGEGSRQKDLTDPRRKRGRPPRVDTPMEVRVKNVLKALRKLKDERYF